jgi:uncharacterized protein (TIGR00255 family)
MTGYGHGTAESPLGAFEVSIKSLNHRFCSINAHLPEVFEPLELRIQELIRSFVRRGRVEYRLDWTPSGGLTPLPEVCTDVAGAYLAGLGEIEERFGHPAEDRIGLISRLPGVFTQGKSPLPDPEAVWTPILEATGIALEELVRTRTREGADMKVAIAGMLDEIEKIGGEIEGLAPGRLERARQRIQDRVDEVLRGRNVDEGRVLLEVTLLADRWDISEEVTRMNAHVGQLRRTIDGDDDAGRRLLFLLQELQREVNTITSKANDAGISHRAVAIKEILEQIREHVENIE